MTIVGHLNHPHTVPPTPPRGPWKNSLPRNRSLVPKMLGTTALERQTLRSDSLFFYSRNWLGLCFHVDHSHRRCHLESIGDP